MKLNIFAVAGTALLVAGCATMSDQEAASKALDMMKASFNERGQAKLDRLTQDDAQRLCSKPPSVEISKENADLVEKANLASIKYPADGKMLGDWRQGEKIAQTGTGMQYSDNPKTPSGGNCYACHELTKAEISFGTMGPSLYNYGKLRGTSDLIQRYTWGKIWNAQAYTACSIMPRFGHNGVLTEQQIKHVAALLLDPESPVNK